MLVREILSELATATKPLVRKFPQEEGSHVLAIGLNKDVILKEHKSDIPARILVIKGAITYVAGEKKTQLDIFDEHIIPIGEYHSIEPQEDSIFLVIKK
jgi:quercetin dioxygenase-like cupin family protein